MLTAFAAADDMADQIRELEDALVKKEAEIAQIQVGSERTAHRQTVHLMTGLQNEVDKERQQLAAALEAAKQQVMSTCC